MDIPDGQLRWVQQYDSIQPETPPYHLSFDGVSTVCGTRIYRGSEVSVYEQDLTGGPPEPHCHECQRVIREHLGL